MATKAADRSLVLHIGMHKTATTYLQNLLSERRYDLLREGVLYPLAGTGSLARGVDRMRLTTREGAQSGHQLFTRPGNRKQQLDDLLAELPAGATTVLISSEDFTLGHLPPEELLRRFGDFGHIRVVVALRRQDDWIESFYKQVVDQYYNVETRPFEVYLDQEGPALLDYWTRLEPWRDLVGPENFHALSYDDLGGGAAIVRKVLEIAGLDDAFLDEVTNIPVPRYESIRNIDTLGVRILNGYRIEDRDRRVKAVRDIYALAPHGDIPLLTPQMREGIAASYDPVNAKIESEWFTEPVPGLRFGARREPKAATITGEELATYLDRVLHVCEKVRSEIFGEAETRGMPE